MSPVTRAFLFQGLKDDYTAKKVLSPIARRLITGQASATIDRLFTSRHVYDLRLIAAVATIVVVWIIAIALVAAPFVGYLDLKAMPSNVSELHPVAYAAIAGFTAFLKVSGPTIVVFGAILTWAYQSGNARLGIVDLFACEIDTICRVVTVTDMVQNQIKQYLHDRMDESSSTRTAVSASRAFDSQESYFPILDSSVNELQKLEVRVVSHITAFYTFIKAVRDSLRQVAVAQPLQAPTQSMHEPHFLLTDVLSRRQDASRNVLYTLYLGLESGRKAIADLVEFEPDRTERTITILISELTAYHFLREQFTTPGEMRHDRLALRQLDYQTMVPALRTKVQDHKTEFVPLKPTGSSDDQADEARQWCAAYQLLHELDSRYASISKLAFDCAVSEEMFRISPSLEHTHVTG